MFELFLVSYIPENIYIRKEAGYKEWVLLTERDQLLKIMHTRYKLKKNYLLKQLIIEIESAEISLFGGPHNVYVNFHRNTRVDITAIREQWFYFRYKCTSKKHNFFDIGLTSKNITFNLNSLVYWLQYFIHKEEDTQMYAKYKEAYNWLTQSIKFDFCGPSVITDNIIEFIRHSYEISQRDRCDLENVFAEVHSMLFEKENECTIEFYNYNGETGPFT